MDFLVDKLTMPLMIKGLSDKMKIPGHKRIFEEFACYVTSEDKFNSVYALMPSV